ACSTRTTTSGSAFVSSSQTLSASDPVTYVAKVFMRGMKVTVPSADPSAGWTVYEDHPGEFNLVAPDRFRRTHIHFLQDPLASSTHDKPIPGVGQTPTALIAWLRQNPDLVESAPRPATIAGHVQGVSVDVGVSKKAPSTNPECGGPCLDWLVFQGRNYGF